MWMALVEKKFKTSFPIKKVIFIFVTRRPIPFVLCPCYDAKMVPLF